MRETLVLVVVAGLLACGPRPTSLETRVRDVGRAVADLKPYLATDVTVTSDNRAGPLTLHDLGAYACVARDLASLPLSRLPDVVTHARSGCGWTAAPYANACEGNFLILWRMIFDVRGDAAPNMAGRGRSRPASRPLTFDRPGLVSGVELVAGERHLGYTAPKDLDNLFFRYLRRAPEDIPCPSESKRRIRHAPDPPLHP